MKLGLRWLLLSATAVGLASCAATYGNGNAPSYGAGYYGGYANYAYPDDFYSPAYGIILGGGHIHHLHHSAGHHGWNHGGMVHGGGRHGGMGTRGGHAGGAGHR